MNALQEAPGVWSMRRALALYYSALAGACFIIGAINGQIAAVYAGGGCGLISLIFMGLTTIQEITTNVPKIGTNKDRRYREDQP